MGKHIKAQIYKQGQIPLIDWMRKYFEKFNILEPTGYDLFAFLDKKRNRRRKSGYLGAEAPRQLDSLRVGHISADQYRDFLSHTSLPGL